MKIICLQENLKKALNITERIIGRSLTLPILNNILLSAEDGKKIKISSTNLEIGITYWLNGKIEEKGGLTVPARLISDFVNNLPNKKVEIKSRDKQLELRCEKYKGILKGISADEFPIIPKISGEPMLKIKGSVLRNSFSQVVEMPAVSESRPEISGICFNFEKNLIKLAATDSFRLAEKKIEADLELKNNPLKNNYIIIPQRTIQEIIRILSENEVDVKLILSNNQVLFDLEHSQVISRIIEGQYPNYQQIIPKDFQTQVIVNRKELINNIRIASLFSSKINDVEVLIEPKKSIIEISAKNADIGENRSKIEAKIEGKPVKIIFNHRYLMDGLNNILSDKVVVGLNSGSAPAVIRPVGDNSYTYVIMPIKL